MKYSMKFFFAFIFLILFSACNSNDTETPMQPQPQPQPTQKSESQTPQFLPPMRAPQYTSFAEDIIAYNIRALDEKEPQATPKKSEAAKNKEEAKETSGEEEDDSSDDSSDDDSGNDDGGDDSSGDDDTNNDNENTSTATQKYARVGGFTLSLNKKSYDFSIVQDFFHKIAAPTFKKQLNGEYIISLTGYVLEDDELLIDKGIFTLELKVPSLNLQNQYIPILSNILTNSAMMRPVNALVTIKQETEGGTIYFNAVIANFQVLDRNQSTAYNANFSVGLKIQ